MLYSLTGVLVLVTAWQFFEAKPAEKGTVQEQNATKGGLNAIDTTGDISGRDKLQASGDGARVVKTEHYHEAPREERLPVVQPAKAPLPRLEMSFGSSRVEVFDSMVDFSQDGGEKANFIMVHNQAAAPGEEASRADSISARVTFTPKGYTGTTSIDRSCWIGKVENEIYLHPGDTERVLLGTAKENEWITYLNPNKRDAGGWPADNQSLREVKFPLFPSAVIVGEITILSNRSSKSITLMARKFVITMSETSFSINIRWQDET